MLKWAQDHPIAVGAAAVGSALAVTAGVVLWNRAKEPEPAAVKAKSEDDEISASTTTGVSKLSKSLDSAVPQSAPEGKSAPKLIRTTSVGNPLKTDDLSEPLEELIKRANEQNDLDAMTRIG